MATAPQNVAILMGDLVDSGAAGDVSRVHGAFNDAVAAQNTQSAAALLSPLTITLGDEFQGVFTTLVTAAKAARAMRYALLEHDLDCRFVVGSAGIATPINPNKAWNMMGHGLSEARNILNEKTPGLTYRFSLPDAPETAALLDAIGAGLSVIERSWTNHQRRDITAFIGGATAEDLARARGVTKRAIYTSRQGGEYDAYRFQWTALLAALQARDQVADP